MRKLRTRSSPSSAHTTRLPARFPCAQDSSPAATALEFSFQGLGPPPSPPPPQQLQPLGYAPSYAAGAAFDRTCELSEYGSLMSECIRAAFDAAAKRCLPAAPSPPLAARQLLTAAAAFDARQHGAGAPTALRYAFVPSPAFLSDLAAAGVAVCGSARGAEGGEAASRGSLRADEVRARAEASPARQPPHAELRH